MPRGQWKARVLQPRFPLVPFLVAVVHAGLGERLLLALLLICRNGRLLVLAFVFRVDLLLCRVLVT